MFLAGLTPVFTGGIFLVAFLALLNAAVNSKIASLKDLFNAKVDSLKENQTEIKNRMNDLESNMEKRMDGLEKRMDNIETKLDQLIAAGSR